MPLSFDEFASSFLRSVGAPNVEYEGMKRAAAQAGMSIEEYQKELERQRQREAEKHAADIQTKKDASLKAQLEREAADADLVARSGLGQGQTASAVRYTGQPVGKENVSGNLAQLGADLDAVEVFRKSRAQVAGETDIEKQQYEYEQERDKLDFEHDDADRKYELDMEELALAKKREERIQGFTDLNMSIMRENLHQLKNGKPSRLSDGQAAQLAQVILQQQGVLEDANTPGGASAQIALMSKQIQHMFENPGVAVKGVTMDVVQSAIAAAEGARSGAEVGSFEDENAEETEFGGGLQEAAQNAGEDPNEGQPGEGAEKDQDPAIPPFDDGVPDARAMDPNVDFMALIGADPEQAARLQQKEMEEDMQHYMMIAKNLIAAGVPMEGWPEEVREFVEEARRRNGQQ